MKWRIEQGDALALLRELPDASVDLIATDPPYAVTGDAAIAASRSSRQPAETQFFRAWLVEHVAEWARVLRPTGAAWLCLDWRGCLILDEVTARLGFRRPPSIGVWDKKRIGMGGILRRRFETFAVQLCNDFAVTPSGEPDLWELPWGGGSSGETEHPAEKPVALMERAVRLLLPRGGAVLDPFAGSGTTGVAALNRGCGFVGFERDPAFAEIARRRLERVEASPTLFEPAAPAEQSGLFGEAAS